MAAFVANATSKHMKAQSKRYRLYISDKPPQENAVVVVEHHLSINYRGLAHALAARQVFRRLCSIRGGMLQLCFHSSAATDFVRRYVFRSNAGPLLCSPAVPDEYRVHRLTP